MSTFNLNQSFAGLGTLNFVAPFASVFSFDGKISLPTIVNGGGASSCLMTVNKNSSPVYTGIAGAEGFKVDINCASGDSIDMVLSSGAAVDQGINAIKMVVAISTGV